MLEIQNLFVTVDSKEIVRGVSLAIRPGEIHALMGPNGSGKSSLAMAIAGHPRYQARSNEQETRNNEQKTKNKKQKSENDNKESKIELDGVDISGKTPDERARRGLFLAMQYPVGVEGVTVEQLLRRAKQERQATPLRPPSSRRTPGLRRDYEGRASDKRQAKLDVLEFRRQIEHLAEQVGVSKELLRRSINVGFSGGEKKRLEILQMLVLEPKYAILDETDSGLDVDAMRTIAQQVQLFSNSKLKTQRSKVEQKTTDSKSQPGVLVITHYSRLLDHLKPDYVHVMREGRIVESGGTELAEEIERRGYQRKLN